MDIDLNNKLMKHEFKVIPKEEILANRSDAYEFIDFNKQETLEEAAENYNLNTINAFSDYESFIEGAKWQKEQYTIEEQHAEHSINDLDKSYMKGFNDGAEWQKTEMEQFAIKFAEWIDEIRIEREILYNTSSIKEILEIYKKEKGL